ncbi:MAG TPA: hypothetical protein VGP64_05950 [Polyangia bacterium]|jgi:hypothetical protein
MRSSRFALALLIAAALAGAPARADDPAPGSSTLAAPGTYNGPDVPAPAPPRRAAPARSDGAGTNGAADARAKNGGEVQQRRDAEIPKRARPTFEATTPGSAPPLRPVSSFSGAQTHVSRPPPAPPGPPPKPASKTQVEELVRRSNDNVDFFELVDDMIDEIARRLALEDPNLYSPMAIRLVRVSANLRPEFAHTLEARLTARLLNATSLKLNICAECTALRSRVENGNWILTLGASNQDDLRRLGEKTGIRTFMDVDFTFSPDQNIIWLEATVLRASDGTILWSDAYRSDGTMTSLLRTGQKIPTREERSAELEQKMAGRPSYGYAASLGMVQMGYTAPTGDVVGAQVALRFHERFGENQNNLFGISAGIFTTGPPSMNKQPQALNSILLGAYYSHDLSAPNLNKPEFWIYGEGGGMFTGNEGNTFYLESGLDVHLKFRLSLQGGLMYVFPTTYSGYDLGGLGFRVRVALNW